MTSVVIPCFNCTEYLGEALTSIRCQSRPVREIILVDDGSDTPIALPTDWDGPPLHLVRTENRGPSAARNIGVARASGEFVAFLDADDLWRSEKVELQERALAADPTAVASYTRCVVEPGFFGFGPYPTRDVDDDEFVLMLWYSNFFPPSSVMVRRESLLQVGGFNEELRGPEDIDLWYRLLTIGRFLQVPRPLCYYRQHPKQFTQDLYMRVASSKKGRAAILSQHADRLVRCGIPPERLWDAYRSDMLVLFYRRQFREVRRLLWDYWRDHPHDWKVLVYAFVSMLPARLVTALRGRIPLPDEAGQEGGGVAARELVTWDSAFLRIRNALSG